MFSPVVIAIVAMCSITFVTTMLYEFFVFRSLQKYADFRKVKNFAYMFISLYTIVQCAGSIGLYFMSNSSIQSWCNIHWFWGGIILLTIFSIPMCIGLYLGWKSKMAFEGMFDR